jgi:hypothetical protein
MSKRRMLAADAALEGITPLEVMTQTMRKLWDAGDHQAASQIAKDAAPYVHPRLQAIQHSGNPESPISIAVATLDKMDAEQLMLYISRPLPALRGPG